MYALIALVRQIVHIPFRIESNYLLFSSHLLFSATGAVLLSLGSVLLWAVIRSIVPPSPVCCTLAGIGTGVAFLKVGSSYLEFVDGQIAKK